MYPNNITTSPLGSILCSKALLILVESTPCFLGPFDGGKIPPNKLGGILLCGPTRIRTLNLAFGVRCFTIETMDPF